MDVQCLLLNFGMISFPTLYEVEKKQTPKDLFFFRFFPNTFMTRHGFADHNTRTYIRLLGPCFKTGR